LIVVSVHTSAVRGQAVVKAKQEVYRATANEAEVPAFKNTLSLAIANVGRGHQNDQGRRGHIKLEKEKKSRLLSAEAQKNPTIANMLLN